MRLQPDQINKVKKLFACFESEIRMRVLNHLMSKNEETQFSELIREMEVIYKDLGLEVGMHFPAEIGQAVRSLHAIGYVHKANKGKKFVFYSANKEKVNEIYNFIINQTV